jgi:hypothetical protein
MPTMTARSRRCGRGRTATGDRSRVISRFGAALPLRSPFASLHPSGRPPRRASSRQRHHHDRRYHHLTNSSSKSHLGPMAERYFRSNGMIYQCCPHELGRPERPQMGMIRKGKQQATATRQLPREYPRVQKEMTRSVRHRQSATQRARTARASKNLPLLLRLLPTNPFCPERDQRR